MVPKLDCFKTMAIMHPKQAIWFCLSLLRSEVQVICIRYFQEHNELCNLIRYKGITVGRSLPCLLVLTKAPHPRIVVRWALECVSKYLKRIFVILNCISALLSLDLAPPSLRKSALKCSPIRSKLHLPVFRNTL